jgi:hypothetical protein
MPRTNRASVVRGETAIGLQRLTDGDTALVEPRLDAPGGCCLTATSEVPKDYFVMVGGV